MSDTVIRVDGLSKHYSLGETIRHDTLRDAIADFGNKLKLFCRRSSNKITASSSCCNGIWALKDISFEVKRGQTLGIIGRNGAGKSTLLKILSRITEPTEGKVEIRGRIASLLEVGTGFHPELTGKENIYLNGAILGMRKKEIGRKFDEIVSFAEIEKFIHTPVKRYSSGMYVRLAFAVAAHLDPEILLVDEVLAVGDFDFQKKCLGKMGNIVEGGRTVVFVSHNMNAIRQLCQTGLIIEQGKILYQGEANNAVEQYLSSGLEKLGPERAFAIDEAKPIQILKVSVCNNEMQLQNQFDINDEILIIISYAVRKLSPQTTIALLISRNGTELLSSFDVDLKPERLGVRKIGTYTYRVRFPLRLLKAGTYSITLSTGSFKSTVFDLLRDTLFFKIHDYSEDTRFKSYAENRLGSIISNLSWEDY